MLNFVKPTISAKPQQFVDEFNRCGQRVELFAPIVRPAQVINGKVVFKEKLLTFYYVFVRGTLTDIKELCAIPNNGFSMMIDKSSERRYGIISDAVMANFRMVVRHYENTLPFYNIEDVALEEGDLVEVVSGEFAGLTGTFMPKPRSNKGNLVIAATTSLGAVIWNIEASYVRILKFAHNTRRQYDLLDSFIPRLYPVMRKYHHGEKLTDKDKSLLTVFSQRMGVVIPENRKLEAKLLATLVCVHSILGDMRGRDESIQRFVRNNEIVTNPWTKALIILLTSVANADISQMAQAYATIRDASTKLTASQKQLLEEYRFYLNLTD